MPEPAEPDPYSRLYWRLADEFPDVYASDGALALYCRLLPLADAAWPASAALPTGTRKAALQMLVDAPLVYLQAGHRFRVRGMDKQRRSRQDAARRAAEARWGRERAQSGRSAQRNAGALQSQSGRSADAMHIPSRAEPSLTEPSQNGRARDPIDPQREGLPHLTADVQDTLEIAAEMLVSTASDRVLTDLDRLVERHGGERVAQTMGLIRQEVVSPSWPQLVYGARNRLEPIPGAPDAKAERERAEAEDHQRRKAADAKALDEPWRRQFREHLEATT